MTISGVTLSSLLTSTLQNGTSPAQSSTSPTTTSSTLNSSPAYVLSLGQQQSETALLGYGNLGKLVNQADAALADMDANDPAVIVTLGDGTPLQESHSVDVQQLAQAQVLASGEYASADESMTGTGTLTVQGGSYDSSTNTFTPNADPVTIQITDGSLNGIAADINAADIGLTASVVQGTDGKYELQLTGQTGAGNAFQLSGINALTYDPSTPSSGSLQAIQSSADALYSVDGGTQQSSPYNTNVAIASGITANLTSTGTMTISVPFGFAQASGASQTLVNSINTLLGGLGNLTGGGDQLAGDTGPASQLAGVIDQALSQVTSSGSGSLSSLADIGITVQSDGTLALDPGKLQSAYTSDPTGTRKLLDNAATAVRKALSGTGGAGDQIKAQLQDLVQSIMAQMPTLADILNQTSSNSSSADDLFGMSSESDPLLATLEGNSSLAAALGQSDQGQSLLSALGADSSASSSTSSTDDQSNPLLAELETELQSESSATSRSTG